MVSLSSWYCFEHAARLNVCTLHFHVMCASLLCGHIRARRKGSEEEEEGWELKGRRKEEHGEGDGGDGRTS